MNTDYPIDSRFDRMEYLLETAKDFRDPEDLLIALVKAMSDREFHDLYLYICRMHDIEPDQEKFNKILEESNYDRALQGK